jgi:hypothetical protein
VPLSPSLISRSVAAGRIGFGLGMLADPARIAGRWIGSDARRPAVRLLTRSLGARDLALGVGALVSSGPEQQRWVAAAILSDATDLGATLGAGSAIPLSGRAVTSLVAGAAVILGLIALRSSDASPDRSAPAGA